MIENDQLALSCVADVDPHFTTHQQGSGVVPHTVRIG